MNVELETRVAALARELEELREQQAATGDILRIISRSTIAGSPTDIQPVLDVVAKSAAQLCNAFDATIYLRGDDWLSVGAHCGPIPISTHGLPLARDVVTGRSVLDRSPVHIHDLTTAGDEFETGRQMAQNLDFRTILAVPLLRQGEAIGALMIRRTEVRPFSDKQIDLLKTFADEAVIAIENVRLFEEVQARNRDVTEALEQQTATAEVLKTISNSAFDLDAVLHTLVKSASDLCHAPMGCIYLRDGDVFRTAMQVGWTQEFLEYMIRTPMLPGRGSVSSRAALTGSVVQIPDVLADPEYTYLQGQQVGHFRTVLGVPLLRDGAVTGVFVLARPVVQPFSQREIDPVQTFSDQAVIALENVRLFEEVRERTADLSEALQQQTATADVLKVISRSTFDLQAVLQTLIDSAARLCGSKASGFFMRDGDVFRLEIAAVGAMRTVLAVPLLRQTELIGAFAMIRTEARPFTTREIDLVKTFADQAVIAIENVRLFDQVQARTQELARSLEDLRTAQDRLIQTEKLASLGQLTAGIAHEIKNPMNFVNNFSSLSVELVEELQEVLGQASLGDKEREAIDELTAMLKGNLDKIVQHGKRADSIVKNMLLHSRAGSGEHRPTSVNAVVEESLNLAYHGARAERKDFNVTLERDLDPAAGEVDLYPQEITRVLLNLISNGFYATMKRAAQAWPRSSAMPCTCSSAHPASSPITPHGPSLARWISMPSRRPFRKSGWRRASPLERTRIGVNAGPAIVGNFGGGRFFDYTAYGDTINIAARLETANKQLGTRICVSETVAGQVPDFRGRPVGDLVLRGRTEPLRAFEPLRPEQYDDPSTEAYLKAFAKLEAADPGALGAFAAEVGKLPGDRLASFHLKRLLNGATGTEIIMD